jgi:hypothetical protein
LLHTDSCSAPEQIVFRGGDHTNSGSTVLITDKTSDRQSYSVYDFFEAPIQKSITTDGADFTLADIGLSMFVPPHALDGTKKVDLLIRPCLSGPFKLPAGYELVSPVYLIEPNKEVKIKNPVTVRIHHYASLRSQKDCEGMVFLSAGTRLQSALSGSVHDLKIIKKSKSRFGPRNPVGEIELQQFCWIAVGTSQGE